MDPIWKCETALSLAVSANVLRVLGADGTRPRDLPPLTGTAKPAVRWATGVLIRAHLAAEAPDPAASRGTVVRRTPGGLDAQRLYHELAATIERRCRTTRWSCTAAATPTGANRCRPRTLWWGKRPNGSGVWFTGSCHGTTAASSEPCRVEFG